MWLFRLWATFTFMDGESGERRKVQYPGEALDFGDKGLFTPAVGVSVTGTSGGMIVSRARSTRQRRGGEADF
jgi:hypothetical protein